MIYRGAIFDMDGVLFDTERVYQQTWSEIARECGVILEKDFVHAISGTNGKRMNAVLEEYYHVEDGAIIANECMKRMREKLISDVPVKTGAYEILRFFREQEVKIAVASSSSSKQIRFNLQKADMEQFFDEIISGTEVKKGKPEPDIFQYAARKLGCEPKMCYVFEDSENGVKAGYAAGCRTIMVPDLTEPTEEIKKYCSDISEDLLQALKKIEQRETGFLSSTGL